MKFSWKMSLLVIYKVLGRFVNTLIAKDKYHLLDRDNLRQPIAMQLCNIQKTFSHFFRSFLKSRSNLDKKMTLIG